MEENQDKIIENLNSEGGVVVMPTDTIYGILGRAFDPKAVDKIYQIKKRTPDKPFIILIADISDLSKFSIQFSDTDKEIFYKIWPGPFSVEFEVNNETFTYRSFGKKLALRLPDNDLLREIIRHTGPLVAPSANLEGEPPAKNIEEAKEYFGDGVDMYVDNGEILEGEPSTLISLRNGEIKILRQGRGVLEL
ncbi:threonylcarbamoyl-AMP synthase [Patescibacteria group bacterium]|nr:threonylcarbamoyl-AMP synthase [Patescibacteria group bacterium]